MATAPLSLDYDVIIVGAGTMGSSSAYHCALLGLRVLVLEQFELLHKRGSSHGRSRIIRRTYPEDYYSELMVDAYKLWEEAESEAGFSVRKTCGGLDFGVEDCVHLLDLERCCERLGLEYEVLTAAEANTRFPLTLPDNYRAVYQKDAAIIDATGAVSMFQDLARAHGAVFRACEEVKRIMFDEAGVCVVTDKGVYTAAKVVAATGAWSTPVLRGCGLIPPKIDATLMTFGFWKVDEDKVDAFTAGNFPIYLHYAPDGRHFYGFPINEVAGCLKAAPHFSKHAIDYPRGPAEPQQDQSDLAGEFFRKHFQGCGHVAPVDIETCMYVKTPQSDFCIDTAHDGKLVVATGFSGHGFKFTPLIGKIVSDLVHSNDTKYDISHFQLPKQSKL